MGYKKIVRLIAVMEITLGLSTIVSLLTRSLLCLSTKSPNVFIFVMLSALASTILGLGLFNEKDWARVLLVFFSGYIALTKIMLFAGILRFNGEIITFIPADFKNGISILYHSFLILFLRRQPFKGVTALLIAFLLAGCLTPGKAKDGPDAKKPPEVYRLDLDNDGTREVVEVDTQGSDSIGFMVTVSGPKKNKLDTLLVPHRFRKIEFIELNVDGAKQIALHFQGDSDYSNLVIYDFKNKKLGKIFNIEGACGIDTDFGSILARIKVTRPDCAGKSCSCDYSSNRQVWVWAGEKFIRER